MKLQDLVEKQRVIDYNVVVPAMTFKLGYKNAIIKGNFDCSHSEITTLNGAPSRVENNFYCNFTNITSLKGAPSYVGGYFHCAYTNIESLHNVHKIIKYIGGRFILSNTIKSHMLGIMYIKGLVGIELYEQHIHPAFAQEHSQLETIFNKHLEGKRNVHDCQEELLEAGLGEFAKL